MRKLILPALLLVAGSNVLLGQTPVENKGISKNYSFSGTAVNTLVTAGSFDIPVSETGNYLIIFEAHAYTAMASTNGCLSSYWKNGSAYVYLKNKNVELSPPAGEYIWYLDKTANGCLGGVTIPLCPSRSYIQYITAGEHIGVRGFSQKIGTQTLAPWSFDGKIQLIRLN